MIRKFSSYLRKRNARIARARRTKKGLDDGQSYTREQFKYLARRGLGIPVHTL